MTPTKPYYAPKGVLCQPLNTTLYTLKSEHY